MVNYNIYYKTEQDDSIVCVAQEGEKVVGTLSIFNQSMYVDKRAIRCAIIKGICVFDDKNREGVFGFLINKALEKATNDKYRYVCVVGALDSVYEGDKWISLPVNRKLCDINSLSISDAEYNSHYIRKINYDSDLPMLEAMHNGYAADVNYLPVRKTPEYWKEKLKTLYKGNAFVMCNSNNMPIALMCNDYMDDKLVVQDYIALNGYKNAFDISLYKWLEKKGVSSAVVDMYANVETNLNVIEKISGRKVAFYVTECFGDEDARLEERKRLEALAQDNRVSFPYIEM